MKLSLKVYAFLWLVISLIGGCGGSSSSSNGQSSSVQLFNLSSNSSLISLEVDDIQAATTGFARPTALFNVSHEGSAVYRIEHLDENSDAFVAIEEEVPLLDDFRYLSILTGDIRSPELTHTSFRLTDFDNDSQDFQLIFGQFNELINNIDVYISEDSETFNDAQLLFSGLDYKTFSAPEILQQDTYTFYITNAGTTNVIFESEPIRLAARTRFFLIARQDFSTGFSNILLNLLASTPSAPTITDVSVDARIRFYNSVESLGTLDVIFDDNAATTFTALPTQTVSDYFTVNSGAHTLTLNDNTTGNPVIENLFINLDDGETPTLFLFETLDLDGNVNGLSTTRINANERVLAFQSQVTLTNLVPESDFISVFFVAGNDEIGTTPFRVTNLGYTATSTINLDKRNYDVFVIETDEVGNELLAFQTTLDLTNTTSNFILVAEKNSNETLGLRLSTIN